MLGGLASGVHAFGGAWGALASGLFAVTLGTGIETNLQQVMVQLHGIAFVMGFAPVATAGILFALQFVFGSLRVPAEAELEGLDLSEHSESAYGFAGGGTLAPEMSSRAAHPVALSMTAHREHPA
jgi:Amt family ammonium transporter